MSAERPADISQWKRQIRRQASANRQNQTDKDALSERICRKLAALPEYADAATVMFYVDFRAEVRTRAFLPTAWQQGKRVVVPRCAGRRLELFSIRGMDELEAGTYGILEPDATVRRRPECRVEPAELDLIVVPGAAFDRRGGRLGLGKGYYDRLLAAVRTDTALVALAFECQLFGEVPMEPHDIYVQKVITERAIYDGQVV